MDHPNEKIISKGGYILLAQNDADGTIIGTCALLNMGLGSYELAKMSVAEGYQGFGIGKMMGLQTIEKAKSIGANRLFLETNDRLKPALRLYETLGFAPLKNDSDRKSGV